MARYRYVVYHAGKAFACIHAANADEAVVVALKKAGKGYAAEECVAVKVELNPRRRH